MHSAVAMPGDGSGLAVVDQSILVLHNASCCFLMLVVVAVAMKVEVYVVSVNCKIVAHTFGLLLTSARFARLVVCCWRTAV